MRRMTALAKAIDEIGGPTKVAGLLGVSAQAVCFWRDGKRQFPVEHCAVLDSLTTVRRWHLRPDDWHRIWPELIGSEGAPPVPAEQQEVRDAA
jgi:DNA-binding transcriptional regulator YdaS (Cro superfamily)